MSKSACCVNTAVTNETSPLPTVRDWKCPNGMKVLSFIFCGSTNASFNFIRLFSYNLVWTFLIRLVEYVI